MFAFPKPDPDAADATKLLLNLSVFAFSQLSTSDQREKTKEFHKKVVEDVAVEQLYEESDEDFRLRSFTELFKKLPFPDQNQFLSTVIKKFKRERQIEELISWFTTELDVIHQQELIEEMVHVAAHDDNNEDFKVKRFTQLCKDYTDYVYMHLVACRKEYTKKREEDDEVCPDWKSGFAEFFLGFSIIWFKGQSSYGQWQLIEQLCDGVKGVTIEKLSDESGADFKLRRFTELCKKVVDFDVQVQFLQKAEQKLLEKRRYLPHRMLLQPQDSASAAELLSQLSDFGFSLLSSTDQQAKIEQLSGKHAAEDVIIDRLADESEEDLRRKTFTTLFNKAPAFTRIHIFKELTKKFFAERRLCESIILFRQLDSGDQQERIEEMFHRSMRMTSKDAKDVILERSSDESEEDFKLRRFTKLCTTPTFLLDRFHRIEAKKWDLKSLQKISGNEEIAEIKQSCYAEFYLGLAVIWFKARCANDPRNPIEVLIGNVNKEGEHKIEKLPSESVEDFRLRRFIESFKQLQFSSQEEIKKEEKKDDSWFR